jgi:hypothetical protein
MQIVIEAKIKGPPVIFDVIIKDLIVKVINYFMLFNLCISLLITVII